MADSWIPTTEYAADRVTAEAAGALFDLLECPGQKPGAGEPLPLLWHWLAFLPQAKQSHLSPDGHLVTGGFLPPTAGKRRMYAGGQIAVKGRVDVNERLSRSSVVSDVKQKDGVSGPLLFVAVDHEISASRGSIVDRNDIVYRDFQANSGHAAGTFPIDDSEWEFGRTIPIDPVLLFRFSALTYNAHRIHYDRDYARRTEGYPGLVVHGPLQAMLLAELVRTAFPQHTVARFVFRSTAPAFDDSPLLLRARLNPENAEVQLAAFTGKGRRTMSATATLPSEKEMK